MPNHVHLIVVPESEDGLRRGIGEAYRRYTRMINFREGWRGASLAGSLCVVRAGRRISPGRDTLRRTEPGPCQSPETGVWMSAAPLSRAVFPMAIPPVTGLSMGAIGLNPPVK